MRWIYIIIIVSISMAVSGAEKVKLLTSFEPEQLKTWGLRTFEEKDGTFHTKVRWRPVRVVKGDATDGEWAWTSTFKKMDIDWKSKKNYVARRYVSGEVFNAFGGFRGKSKKFPDDWSGYARLRLDVKSTKSPMALRLHLYDEMALPPVQRVFQIPAGKWVTLDLNLAKASQLHEMKLSEENQKKYNTKTAKLRMFNPAKMANFMVIIQQCDQETEFIMDNLRLVADEKAETAKFPLITCSDPYPKPNELIPSKPEPVKEFKITGEGVFAKMGEPVFFDLAKERKTSYGRLSEMVRHGITSAGPDRIIFAQADFFPNYTLDKGKTWQKMGNLRHSRNAPGIGVGAAGPDLIGVYVARCHGSALPVDMFFRIVRFDGKGWTASEPYLADIDSWHCPEFKVEVIRLPSGRIWGVWMDSDRFSSYHSTLRARYSDNGGKFWQDPDSNCMINFNNPSGIGKPMPIGVTWWWKEPNITPPLNKANGRIGRSHPHTNLAITPYKEHVAVIFCTRSGKLSYSIFEGSRWSEPKLILSGQTSPASATTLGTEEMYAAIKGKVFRFEAGKWIEDSPSEKGCSKVVACNNQVVCIGKKVSESGDKQIHELWYSFKPSGGTWSQPQVFAKEETAKGRAHRIDIIAPQFAHDKFVPVAWGPRNSWIKVLQIPVK